MKAQEIRLGNYVMDYDGSHKIFKVKSITKEKKVNMFFINGRWDSDVLPIPLTEEWLLKFGFEKYPHSWGNSIFHLTEWDNYHMKWCVAFNKNNAIIIQKLQYVHQLQNLYSALTGKELNLK